MFENVLLMTALCFHSPEGEDDEDEEDEEDEDEEEEEDEEDKDTDSLDESFDSDTELPGFTLPGVTSQEPDLERGMGDPLRGATYQVPDAIEWEHRNQGLGKSLRAFPSFLSSSFYFSEAELSSTDENDLFLCYERLGKRLRPLSADPGLRLLLVSSVTCFWKEFYFSFPARIWLWEDLQVGCQL